jgi:hypothetical protein
VAEAPRPGGFSLRRWSQRKLAAAQRDEPARSAHRVPDEPAAKADPARSIAPLASTNPEHADVRDHPMHVASGAPGTSAMAPAPAAGATGKAVALPPLESLTIDSDFSPFMQAGVDEDLKRNALRKLLRDPQFNVMDGLDVYIDDYSKPSPLEPELARTLMQARYIFDAPKTRVTAEGIVEDVPQGDDAGAAGAPAAAEGTQSSAPAAIRAGANAALPGESATAETGTAPFAAAADPAAASAPSAPSTPASNR